MTAAFAGATPSANSGDAVGQLGRRSPMTAAFAGATPSANSIGAAP